MDKRLIDYAARLFGVKAEDILNPKQRQDRGIVTVRAALAWVLLRARPHWTRQEIAEAIGLADRKSVYHGEKRADDIRRLDRSYQAKLDRLLLVAGRSEEQPIAPQVQAQPKRPPFQPDALARWAVRLQGGTYRQTVSA